LDYTVNLHQYNNPVGSASKYTLNKLSVK